MELDDLYDRLEQSRAHCLGALFALARKPSISSDDTAVRECAALLIDMLQQAGLDAELCETGGRPLIYAQRMVAPQLPTILFYGHYDVVTAEPLDAWHSPPFQPEVRDGKIFGRGTSDNKGQLLAHAFAVKIWLETRGELPVNVKMILEGEEECDSPHLDAFVARNRERLKADLVYTSDGALHNTGAPLILLGVRGELYIEFTAHGAKWDNHSGNKGGVVPNPIWTLVQALAGMKNALGSASKNAPDVIQRLGIRDLFAAAFFIFFAFLALLEDTGYMARVSFIMDKLMHLIGLHGKSFIPLLMGFGCNVPAIMASRTLENRKDRIITMLITPLMSCSARLPVYILIISAFFTEYQGLILVSIYLTGIILGGIMPLLMNKTIFRKQDVPFVMELPPYRLPTLRNSTIHMWYKGSQYLRKWGQQYLWHQ